MSDEIRYEPLRHAAVDDEHGAVVWVTLARWRYDDRTDWCVECWEERGEADEDKCFATEQEAEAAAIAEFGVRSEDWKPGPNPFGRPGG